MSDNKNAGKKAGIGCQIAFWLVFLVPLGIFLITDQFKEDPPRFYGEESDVYTHLDSFYGGADIPRFDQRDAQRLSQALAAEERKYGVCFGWKLIDGSMDAESVSETDPPRSYDQGSSRGPNTPASTCQRWAEVRATVAYTSETSDDWSAVDFEVAGSDNLGSRSRLPDDSDFAQLGIDAAAFIESPVDTTGHAALSLPLTLTQDDVLRPRPADSASGERPQQSLPPADGGVQGIWAWIWMSLLGVVTLVALLLGIRGVRAAHSSGGGSAPPPPQSGGPPQGGPPQGGPPQGGPPPGQGPPPGNDPGRPQTPSQGPPQQGPPQAHPGPPPQGFPPQGPPQPPAPGNQPPPQGWQPPGPPGHQGPPPGPPPQPGQQPWPPQSGPPGQGPPRHQ